MGKLFSKPSTNKEEENKSQPNNDKNVEEKNEEKQENKPAKKKDADLKITLFEWKDINKGEQWRKLFNALPKYGKIHYEAPNQFWSLHLGEQWTKAREEFAKLTDQLYSKTDWYNKGKERGNDWANELNEANPTIATIVPTSLSGAHITLGRFDIESDKCPACFKEGKQVDFEILKLICHPPFRPIPKNLPGQTSIGEYRFYATHWMSLAIEFVDFDYKTRFPPHISLCNIAVKLKIEDVDKYEQIHEQNNSK